MSAVIQPLAKNACQLICSPELPEDCKKALTVGAGARSPLNLKMLTSLRSAFLQVPDPRRAQSRRLPLSAMLVLTLIALGLLMGGRDMLNIWRKVAKLDQMQRATIGLKVRSKQSGLLTIPGYDALNDLLNALDPHAYATALTAWLQANNGILSRSLSLDGKYVGDGKCGMVVTLCRHEDGRPVAIIPATGKKEDCEVIEARSLLADPLVRVDNALVTADPLHNKEATLRVIVEKGGTTTSVPKPTPPSDLKRRKTASKTPPFCPEL